MFIQSAQLEEVKAGLKKGVVNLFLFAEGSSQEVEAILEYANQNDYTVAGGIFPMVIHDQAHYESGCVLKHISSSHDPYIAKDIGKGNFDFQFQDLQDEDKSCFVFLDGLMVNIPRFLERLYEKYWINVKYIGAGCGSLSLKQTKCVFDNTGIYQDSALVVLSSDNMSLGVKHGWEKVAGPFVANKTEGNKVIELNWRPAFEVYKEIVEAHTEQRFDGSDFFSISKGFPFGIYKEGREDIVRDPIAVEDDGSLVCVGNVSQNVSLNILKGDAKKLINSAEDAANSVEMEKGKDLFIVDCISRVLYLEDQFTEEIQSVNKVIADQKLDIKAEGVLSIGEISSGQDGYLELYNKTIVISAFS